MTLWDGSFAASILALSVTACAVPPLPKGEALAKPHTLHLNRKLYRYAKGSPFEERLPPFRGKMSRSDKRGSLSPQVTERARTLPLGKVAANTVSRRKGYPQQAVYRLIY